MNTLEKIKDLCELNHVSLHKLEMDLGFGNGSLAKSNTISFDRAVAISRYFNVELDYLKPDETTSTEQISEATRLYSLYVQAPPEIRSVIETLLKSHEHDS